MNPVAEGSSAAPLEGHEPGSCAAARHALVEAHLGLATHLARRFAARGEPFDELVQVARLALVGAAARFDPSRGVAFSTFATRTILGELKRHFRDRVWAVRVPRPLQELLLAAHQTEAHLAQRLGRPPSVPELAGALGVDPEQLLAAQEAAQAYRTLPLPAAEPEDSGPEAERTAALADPAADRLFHCAEIRAGLQRALAELAPRDRRVLWLRFGEGLSQSEIGRQLGVSQMQISRILTRSLARLRALLAESAPPAVDLGGPLAEPSPARAGLPDPPAG
ncbi:sigma-70 family RNA polymerase sigma factor [Aciditerrimonas ferrireducens]|uniref:sigma-70 family RNA polymerase sigma factor n=1 Tax=Aciditerrimonas ferrireducens TaxID=667306 RepID=UPI002003F991|nr:sigma-70 family RNA polymerase sigma factor [Aciditerrimonas ferrireducens]MCK4176589.1 sigma-70 family RNA polymerase sigma factor [Aciditerrimonas ferrireducens]